MSIEDVIRLKDREEIIGVVRQFPLAYLNQLLLAVAMFAGPFFLMIPLFQAGGFGIALMAIMVLSGLFIAFRTLIRWYWTVFIITNRRVVDVDQRGFFDRFVSEATYEKVQDVSYARKGFWGTVLNYGTLVVQTAGATAHLEQCYVRRPQDVQHLIVETMGAYLSGPPGERNGKVQALLEAAAGLTNAEARAFLTEIKGAVDGNREEAGATEEEIDRFMTDDVDGEGDGEGDGMESSLFLQTAQAEAGDDEQG